MSNMAKNKVGQSGQALIFLNLCPNGNVSDKMGFEQIPERKQKNEPCTY